MSFRARSLQQGDWAQRDESIFLVIPGERSGGRACGSDLHDHSGSEAAPDRALGLSELRHPATVCGRQPRGVATSAAGPMGRGAPRACAESSPRRVPREGPATRSASGGAAALAVELRETTKSRPWQPSAGGPARPLGISGAFTVLADRLRARVPPANGGGGLLTARSTLAPDGGNATRGLADGRRGGRGSDPGDGWELPALAPPAGAGRADPRYQRAGRRDPGSGRGGARGPGDWRGVSRSPTRRPFKRPWIVEATATGHADRLRAFVLDAK